MEHFRLTVFEAVYSLGSYTKAARQLGITQPAVSQNIAELEKELGTALFVRGAAGSGDIGASVIGGKMTPTPAAELFRVMAVRVLKGYEDIGVLFSPEAASYEVVRLRADRSASEYVLPKVIDILRAAQPNVRFEVLPPADAEPARTSSESVEEVREPAEAYAAEVTAQEPAVPADVTITTIPVRQGGSLTLRFEAYGAAVPFVEAVRLILTELCV